MRYDLTFVKSVNANLFRAREANISMRALGSSGPDIRRRYRKAKCKTL